MVTSPPLLPLSLPPLSAWLSSMSSRDMLQYIYLSPFDHGSWPSNHKAPHFTLFWLCNLCGVIFIIIMLIPWISYRLAVQLLSCVWLCDPMGCSTPRFLVHQQLTEFTQNLIHWVSDAIQPFHPLSSLPPPTFNLSQHQGLFKWVSSLHQVTKVLEFQLQHQSFQWIFRTDFL